MTTVMITVITGLSYLVYLSTWIYYLLVPRNLFRLVIAEVWVCRFGMTSMDHILHWYMCYICIDTIELTCKFEGRRGKIGTEVQSHTNTWRGMGRNIILTNLPLPACHCWNLDCCCGVGTAGCRTGSTPRSLETGPLSIHHQQNVTTTHHWSSALNMLPLQTSRPPFHVIVH